MTVDVSFDKSYIEKLRQDVIYPNELDNVSLEGFIDILKKIPAAIKNFLGFSKSVKVTSNPLVTLSDKDYKKVNKIMEVPYLDMTHKMCYIPPYYTGTYLQYCELLEKISEYNSGLIVNMKKFEKDIGYLLSIENSELKDYSKEHAVAQTWKVNRDQLKKELASLFTSKNSSDKTDYKQVVKRQADWNDVLEKFSNINKNLNDLIGKSKELNTELKVISGHLILLKDKIEKGEFDKSTKSLANYISEGCLEMAEQIEFYALARYQYEILYKCLKDTIDGLSR